MQSYHTLTSKARREIITSDGLSQTFLRLYPGEGGSRMETNDNLKRKRKNLKMKSNITSMND